MTLALNSLNDFTYSFSALPLVTGTVKVSWIQHKTWRSDLIILIWSRFLGINYKISLTWDFNSFWKPTLRHASVKDVATKRHSAKCKCTEQALFRHFREKNSSRPSRVSRRWRQSMRHAGVLIILICPKKGRYFLSVLKRLDTKISCVLSLSARIPFCYIIGTPLSTIFTNINDMVEDIHTVQLDSSLRIGPCTILRTNGSNMIDF